MVAKEKKHGCIWSGPKKSIVLGARQAIYDDDLMSLTGFDTDEAERTGFPLRYQSPQFVSGFKFHPWYERKAKKDLEKATR